MRALDPDNIAAKTDHSRIAREHPLEIKQNQPDEKVFIKAQEADYFQQIRISPASLLGRDGQDASNIIGKRSSALGNYYGSFLQSRTVIYINNLDKGRKEL